MEVSGRQDCCCGEAIGEERLLSHSKQPGSPCPNRGQGRYPSWMLKPKKALVQRRGAEDMVGSGNSLGTGLRQGRK